MVKQKFYPNTNEMTEALNYWNLLKSNLDKIMTQGLFTKKVTMAEKLEYLRELSKANSLYWMYVYRKYPKLIGKDITGNGRGVTLNI